jgi:hypothetical protein
MTWKLSPVPNRDLQGFKMSNKKPLIPFSWMPGSWGLRGKTREIAQAEYELSGEDLELRLLEINHGHDAKTLELEKLELQLKNSKIDKYEYDCRLVDLTEYPDDAQKNLSLLDIEKNHNKISQIEYERKRADILKEPWVSMPVINWDPNISNRTFFELDYNEYFLRHLKDNGYEGDDDTIINRWLNDICISIAEDINGMDADLITPTRRADPEQE